MARVMAMALCLALAGAAFADEPVDSAQSAIRAQMKAFLEDDAEAAYSFASPEIRAKFPDKLAFLEMVKRNYRHLYRPGHFAFGRSKVVGDDVIQEVLVSGSDGKDWTALYSLVRGPDGGYTVNGVIMVQTAPGPEL